jgi:peptide/nickel transport system substrate-binding protein
VAVGADVETLLPPFALASQSKFMVEQLFDRLADIDDSLDTVGDRGFTPHLADRWSWSPDSLAISFHLDPRARWHDGVPVRSTDVRYTYRLYTDTAVGVVDASQLAAIDSVTAPDSLTAVFWFKHRYPEQFFDATYQMLICPEHLLARMPAANLRTSDFARHPVGDSRFRFVSWTPGATLELVADTANYRGRANLDRLILEIAPDRVAAYTKVLSGDADLLEVLRPENLADVRRHADLVALPYEPQQYGFLGFNLHAPKSTRPHPLFGDRALRRALAMSLDRDRMVRNVFDTLAVVPHGPFARTNAAADSTAPTPPYDTVRADRMLDSLGWRRGPDGVRSRGGRPLSFTLTVPTSSQSRQQLALLIQDQLARVGVRVVVDPIEMRTFIARQQDHDFDAVLQVWHTDPSIGGVRQTWITSGARGGVNYGSYENPAFDALADSAVSDLDAGRRREHFHRLYTIINNDVPAVWLYDALQIAVVNHRIHTSYFRPDAWWAHVADWYIPPGERIARDKIGLADARR